MNVLELLLPAGRLTFLWRHLVNVRGTPSTLQLFRIADRFFYSTFVFFAVLTHIGSRSADSDVRGTANPDDRTSVRKSDCTQLSE